MKAATPKRSELTHKLSGWPPPRHEWDFRSVTPERCRLACLWEYARSVDAITSDPDGWVFGNGGEKGKGLGTILSNYLICEGGVLLPWVTMHDLAYNLFSQSDLKDLLSLASKMMQGANQLDVFVWSNLEESTRQHLSLSVANGKVAENIAVAVVNDLNRIIKGSCIHTEARFAGIELRMSTSVLVTLKRKQSYDLARLNRMLLEDAYPNEIVRGRAWQPMQWRKFNFWEGPATFIRSVVEVKKEIRQAIASGQEVSEVLDRHLSDLKFVMFADVYYHTTADIVAELESWVRTEKKKFQDRPKGRAAHPPFERLKWLAAYRLDKARKLVSIRFEKVQSMLQELDCGHPDASPTLPIYASQGAWSKAIGDATGLLILLESNPQKFEQELVF